MKDIIIKIISILIVILIFIFLISGSFSSQNIDKLAYVVALGFDIGEQNNLKMSFQISIPSSEAGTDSGGSSSQSSNVIVNTVECSSIDSGIALVNSYISKELNLSHCKIIIFSEELASTGIAKYIYTLINKIQIRPDANILVSRCNVEYFLKNSEPTLEKLSARYYEIAPTSTKYTGFTVNAKIGDFFASLTDSFSQSYAILGSVNTDSSDNNSKNLPNNEKDTSYVAGETPINTNKKNIDNIGTAVFKDDVFVGELNALETICHLIVSNKLKTCNITIPSPFSQNDTVDLNLKFKNKTKVKLDLVNGSPYIRVKCGFDARILSMDSNSNYLEEQNLKILSDYANSYLEESVSNYLYKISKEYQSDIDAFGKYAVSKFLYWQDWEDYNWLDNFKNSFFSVDIDCNVKSGLILLDT